MTLSRRLAALLAVGALPVAVLASIQPTAAAPSPSTLTVGVAGAGPASQSFSGGPITGSEDASGNATPPPSCDQPACESIPLTVVAPPGTPHLITVTVTVNFDAAQGNPEGLTGLDAYILDSNGNELGGDPLGSAPSVAVADKIGPGSYTIEVTGEALAQGETYTGTVAATLASAPGPPATTLSFGPSTVVSPVILGGEPQISQERPVANPKPGAGLDPQRGFVDWPVSSRTQIGTLWRTINGGESYRQIVDLSCAERQVPNCYTGGGGDTVNRVNNYDGTVLFGDQESLAQEAFASSADHGDSFPVARQTAVSSAATGVDRQWISAVDAPGIMAGPFINFELEGLFSYHIPDAGEYVAGVGTDGILRPGADPVIPSVSQSGPSRVDVQAGSHGSGWFYQSYRDSNGFEVASVPLTQYQDRTAYHVNLVNADQPQVFPWITLDKQGNLYAVWVSTDGQLYYSVSRITDKANDPAQGGVPASTWSAKVQVNPPALGSTIFPEVIAGDAGRIAIVYMATSDYTGISDNAPAGNTPARWKTYLSESVNALDPHPTFLVGDVSHRYAHLGSICTSGTTCIATGGDRSLLDMIDITMDSSGRVQVVYCDNNTSFARQEVAEGSQGSGFVKVARLATGPSLLAGHAPFAVTYPTSYRKAAAGDATWPNTAAGVNLPSLDITGVGANLDGSDLVGRIDLSDAGAAAFARDLTAYNTASSAAGSTDPSATRLQYVLRWDSPEGETYYLTAETDSSGNATYYGGKVDSSSAVNNVSSAVAIAYRPQTGFTVTGQVSGHSLLLRAPLSQFGLHAGSTLVALGAYSLAGAADTTLAGQPETSQVLAAMRDVDSSPAIDALLSAGSVPGSTAVVPPTTTTTTGAAGLSGTPNTGGAPLTPLAPLAASWVIAGVVLLARRSRRRDGLRG
jgi:hypothetical protein